MFGYHINMTTLLRAAVRGIAFFLGAFSAVNIFVSRVGSAPIEDIWWIDASVLGAPAAGILAIAAATALVAFALRPRMGIFRKWATIALALSYVVIACLNSVDYFTALSQGGFDPLVPIPLSLVVALLFVAVAGASLKMHDRATGPVENVLVVLFAVAGVGLFPLAQMAFFGTTNYATQADVAIVFGARVYPDGTLSTSVKDRMDTAIRLHEQGLIPTILITGGIDEDGVDETEHMRNYAIEKGVGAGDIIVDNTGFNTDMSVANTAAIIREREFDTVLAVSQFYHLPRIKMAYRALKVPVRTVPAVGDRWIPNNIYLTVREIPAFWVYWFRSGVRDVSSSELLNLPNLSLPLE